MKHSLALCILLLAAFIPGQLNAQAYQPGISGLRDNWRINLNAGSSIFYGDLKDKGILPYDIDYKIGYGFVIRKQLSPVFGVGGQVYNSKLKSTEKYTEEGIEKAITFDADVFEYNLHLLLDFVPLFNGYAPDRKLSAYMFLGLGLSNWKTIVSNYKTGETIRVHGFTGKGPGKRTTELVMPVGLGLRYNVNNQLGITFETALHPVNSDFLDATAGGINYDMYHYTSLGISFFLKGSQMRDDRSREVVRIKKRQARRKSRNDNENYREPSQYYYQDIQNSETVEQTEPEIENRTDIDEFKKKYKESDLPVVSEYNMTGVFGRNTGSGTRTYQQEKAPELLISEPTILEKDNKSRTLTSQTSGKETQTAAAKTTDSPAANPTEKIYGVQIFATRSEADISLLRKKYNIEEKITPYKENGLIRYVLLSFPTYKSASAYARILHERGLKDAFVVAYQNGKRIAIKQ